MHRVFILGAGASAGFENSQCAVSPPVTRTFFDKAIELHQQQSLNLSELAALNRFLTRYYHRALSEAGGFDVEDVLTMIDLAADDSARNDMLHLITAVLDRTLYGQPCKHHTELLAKMSPSDTIITFNWDLILDNIVATSNQGYPDYGACSTVLGMRNTGRLNGSSLCHRPMVLKLHGSLNWMHCRSCNRTYAFMLSGKTGANHFAGHREPCPDCSGATEPLIIPPTLLKSYRYGVIEEVWKQARQALSRAEEIIIVGYSLPPTDFRARWLFMEASAEPRCRRVAVYDKSPTQGLADRLAAAFHAQVDKHRGGIKEAVSSEMS